MPAAAAPLTMRVTSLWVTMALGLLTATTLLMGRAPQSGGIAQSLNVAVGSYVADGTPLGFKGERLCPTKSQFG